MTERTDTLLPAILIDRARAVLDANRAAGRCIAVAESCTGGLVAAALTEIAGSSDVFMCGFVTYSDSAKRQALGVAGNVIETFGAVSIATAWAMAQGALERTEADVAVSITGIAGPGGGSERKPVGTVVFARAEKGAAPDKIKAERRELGDLGRGGVRLQAALVALDLLMPDAETSAP
ncbi:nicotinamide-nucleotide amidase [Sphingomonas jejuensis]|uniref:Nicotinamide-nucleotide amidase n=1 Tax=Sphingomonas jejuensis TaxID=904715 RepID=A0ABX0XL91_9SPHN|nr:CinA family protein [Sphingomonas jejuensis]NJC33486.1 nicotinamide-nucleotide amidase [Sphingomonas jejuensis]